MPAKHSYEHVKDCFERYDWTLLSTGYVNAHAKLQVLCSEGHRCEVRFYSFKAGSRCLVCSGNAKLTYKYVRKYFENEGWTLLSKEYVNARTNLHVLCPEEHGCEMSFDNFSNRGRRCKKCDIQSRTFSIEYVQEYFESFGWVLLSLEYVNVRTHISAICPEGHACKITLDSFKRQGTRCPSCAKHGFNPEKPAILYYLEILHRGRLYYKIGITNNTVEKRYSRTGDREKIKILATWEYEYGGDAYDEEQKIIQSHEEFRYRGNAKILDGVGNTEMFSKNVLVNYCV